ncbi:hypothetical protein WUBG_01666 [Wuchereria bancrofti]|uniref:Uncharacterized protein n=1 Tax=Wuchereria bancrofti TaxID=6293 RepID=J9FJB2_WUCBA|nr:hypothetical protein WUBG_01666 [Wuchereria bancrofti]
MSHICHFGRWHFGQSEAKSGGASSPPTIWTKCLTEQRVLEDSKSPLLKCKALQWDISNPKHPFSHSKPLIFFTGINDICNFLSVFSLCNEIDACYAHITTSTTKPQDELAADSSITLHRSLCFTIS